MSVCDRHKDWQAESLAGLTTRTSHKLPPHWVPMQLTVAFVLLVGALIQFGSAMPANTPQSSVKGEYNPH